ncbi:MAG: PepSY domain-containing protein, partial [Clostridiales bacterium]|nr:PepSY domain-containing protein [Clostridiales bacterium]
MVKILKTITVFALTALLAAGLAACGTAASAEVSRDDAINEALMHVEGAGKDDVVSVEEDENEYDIEIYYDGVEYSFDISKKDGSVLNASTENDNKG